MEQIYIEPNQPEYFFHRKRNQKIFYEGTNKYNIYKYVELNENDLIRIVTGFIKFQNIFSPSKITINGNELTIKSIKINNIIECDLPLDSIKKYVHKLIKTLHKDNYMHGNLNLQNIGYTKKNNKYRFFLINLITLTEINNPPDWFQNWIEFWDFNNIENYKDWEKEEWLEQFEDEFNSNLPNSL